MTISSQASIAEAEPKPWWQSKTILGAVVVILGLFTKQLGLTIDEAGLVNDVVTLIGAALSIYGRLKAASPIKGTKGAS